MWSGLFRWRTRGRNWQNSADITITRGRTAPWRTSGIRGAVSRRDRKNYCSQAAEELDPEKLIELVEEINKPLLEKEGRLGILPKDDKATG